LKRKGGKYTFHAINNNHALPGCGLTQLNAGRMHLINKRLLDNLMSGSLVVNTTGKALIFAVKIVL
jgi:hypothetical protein